MRIGLNADCFDERSRRVNVLQLITELDIGGAEKLLLSFIKKLNRSKYNVITAYLNGEGKLAGDFRKAGFKVFNLRMRNRMDLGAVIRLYRFLKRENIGILHTHLIQADLCGFIAGKMASVPVIISTKHNPDEFRKRFSICVRLDGIFSNHSDRVIAVSHAVKDFLVKWEKISEGKFTVIHNGVNLEEFSIDTDIAEKKRELGINLSSKVVGSVGRLDRQKGHVFFLKAIPKILEDFSDIRFIFVGEGPLRSKLEKMASELRVNQNIIFTGIRPDVADILSILDIFVLPSIFEGFGIVLLEAMAIGKPVVASRVGGIPEIVDHGLTGILIEPANPSAIAGSVVKLLKNPVEAKRIANAGRAEVGRRFTADAMARKIEGVYDEILT